MTEEDTFNRLCRPTIAQMTQMVTNFIIEHNKKEKITTVAQVDRFLRQHNWTLFEYDRAVSELKHRAGIK